MSRMSMEANEADEVGGGPEVLCPWRHQRVHLTRRESEVLSAAAVGLSNVGIGRTRFLSVQAVAYHVSNLLQKFDAASRTELVAKAYSCGILAAGTWPPALAQGCSCGRIVASPEEETLDEGEHGRMTDAEAR